MAKGVGGEGLGDRRGREEEEEVGEGEHLRTDVML